MIPEVAVQQTTETKAENRSRESRDRQYSSQRNKERNDNGPESKTNTEN